MAGLRGVLEQFSRDEGGYAMIMTAVLLVPMLGITGLVVDLSRQQNTHSGLQSIVDAAALAGARQLDGTEWAIENATAAATAYLTAQPRFADGTVGTPEFTFFTGSRCESETSDPIAAACMQVMSEWHTLRTTFAAAIGFDEIRTQASATAESRFVACAVQPLMLCSPWGSEFNLSRGEMLRLKPRSGTGNVLPGDFGLLDPPGLSTSGGPAQALHLAQAEPPFCYTNEISVRTGGTTGAVNDGIGARFGFYPSNKSDPLWQQPPAPNTIKGMTPKTGGGAQKCQKTDFNVVPDGRVPRDTCLPQVGSPASATGTCIASTPNILIGDGDWSASAGTYWSHHHTGPMPTGLGRPGHPEYRSRYDLYLNELGCDPDGENCSGTPNSGYAFKDPPAESMAPLCNKPAGGPERRTIYVAVVDCSEQSQQVTGTGTQTTVRGNKVAKFFLTEPPDNGEIYAEFVDLITADNDMDGKLKHIVQLVLQ